MQALSQSCTASRLSFSPPRPHSGGTVGPVLLSRDLSALSESAALAHDAANILSALLLYCDLLQQPGVLRPRHQHYASELNDIARRNSGLVERLLEKLSHEHHPPAPVRARSEPSAGSHRPPAAGAPYQAAAKLHEMVPLLRSMAFPYATLEIFVADRLPDWTVPSAKSLERIVVNLVCNAAQGLAPRGISCVVPVAAPDGGHELETPVGRISVTLRRSGNRILLEVADNGPGIAAETAAAFLLPSDPRSGPESSLGHCMVHELAAETGARLAVRSRPRRGTTFSLSWPGQHGTAPSAIGTAPVAQHEQQSGN